MSDEMPYRGVDLTALVETVARLHYERAKTQAEETYPGIGQREWDDLDDHGKHAVRSALLPVVVDVVDALTPADAETPAQQAEQQAPATVIPSERLTELRVEARTRDRSPFVDSHEIRACTEVLQRRGETWAAAVLGRELERRSLVNVRFPWLGGHELWLLIRADVEEDRVVFEQVVGGQD